MTRKNESKAEGFLPSESVGTDLNLKPHTNDKSVKAQLRSPGINYYYFDEYFKFGVTAPEGSVIPYDMIGQVYFKDAIRIIIETSKTGIAVGDTVRGIWVVRAGEDSYEFQSEPVLVESTSWSIAITVPDSEVINFLGRESGVGFIHTRQEGGSTVSPLTRVYVAPKMGTKPVLKVTGVVDGVLNTKDHPDGIKVIIDPIENMHRYNALQITWSQGDDVLGDDILIDAQRHMTVYPDQAMEFVIPPIVYQPHVGKRVLVKYTINLGAGMKSNLQWHPSALTNVEFDLV